jgi:DNA-binding transcriptional LysR family regulator
VRTVLVASPAYLARAGTPRSLDALHEHPCIAFLGTSPLLDRWTFDRRTITVRPRLIVNTGQAAIDAALAGLGIARVLSYQVDRLVAADRLRIVLPDTEPRPVPVQLVTLPGIQPRIAATFADHATGRLRKRLAAG